MTTQTGSTLTSHGPREDELLALYADFELSPDELPAFESHMEGCDCCQAVLALLPTALTPSAMQTDAPSASSERYRLESLLGQGAMGAVYLATDTWLERKVALKFIHAPKVAGSHFYLHESRALAALTHPCINGIYDVGILDGDAYLALEYIQGPTLRAWLSEKPSKEQILTVFRDAARGLCAAHEQNLIHRDFKPENVLLREGGKLPQAVVCDFGLAAVLATPADTTTTHAVGTPGYMAPEAWQGVASDRGDVFSFCVSLVEALLGHRPKAGEPASQAQLPVGKALRALVVAGLSTDPSARPTMQEIENELGRELGRPRRRRLLLASLVMVGMVGGAASFAFHRGGVASPGCQADVLAKTAWNSEVRARLKKILLAQGQFAEANWSYLDRELSHYQTVWTKLACELERKPAAEAAVPAQMMCLRDQLAGIGTFMELMSKPAPRMWKVLTSQLATFANPADCLSVQVKWRNSQPVYDKDSPQRHEIQEHFLKAKFAYNVRDQKNSSLELAAMKEAIERTPGLADQALYRAQAGHLQCIIDIQVENFPGAQASCEAAAHDAELAAADNERLAILSALMVLEAKKKNFAQAHFWESQGQSVATHPGVSPAVVAQFTSRRSFVSMLEGVPKKAYELAQQFAEQAKTLHPTTYASALEDVGTRAYQLKYYAEAETWLRQSLALYDQQMGPNHPATADAWQNLALVLQNLLRFDEAIVAYDTAQRLFPANETKALALIASNLTTLYLEKGDLKNAEISARQASDVVRKNLSKDPALMLSTDLSLANVLAHNGKTKEAHSQYLSLWERTSKEFGPEHVHSMTVAAALAGSYLVLDELKSALPLLQNVVKIASKAYSRDDKDVLRYRSTLAYVLYSLGNAKEARIQLSEVTSAANDTFTLRGYWLLTRACMEADRGNKASADQLLAEARELFVASLDRGGKRQADATQDRIKRRLK